MNSDHQVPESVLKCVEALKCAKTDNEKLAALFTVTKLIKASECDNHSLKLLYEAIGFNFLHKLLRSTEVPADCPPFIYKSIALSIVSCFCHVQDIVESPAIISIIPVLLDIVSMADDDDMEHNLMLVSDCYACLEAIAASENGRKALLEKDALVKLADVYIEEMFRHDQALHLLAYLATFHRRQLWTGHEDRFKQIITRVANEFNSDSSERKFELCRMMATLLSASPLSFKKEDLDEDWSKKTLLALEGILCSRIDSGYRDDALILTSRLIELFGIHWGLKSGPNSRQFLLLLVNLACVEVRMKLEDKTLDQAMAMANVLVACYSIIENFLTFMVTQEFLEFDSKQREQAYCALKGAVGAILGILHQLSLEYESGWDIPTSSFKTDFVCAAIRVLGAWLSEETASMKEEINSILPFVVGFCKKKFEEMKSGAVELPDVLRFVLPAFCHLSVEDQPRRILLDQKTIQLLYDYLMYQWDIFHKWLSTQPTVASDWLHVETAEQEILAERNRPESESAVILTCGIFMNIAVLEPELVATDPVFSQILKFCITNLPSLVHRHDFVVFLGNLAVLGLLVLRHLTWKHTHGDSAAFRFIQGCISFLWDAHNSEDSADSLSLVISLRYKKDWPDLAELWFLGMQGLSNVMDKLDWIVDFIVDSGWPQEMMKSLSRIISGAIDANTRTAYEDFLCCLLRAQPTKVKAVIMENGGKKTCRQHTMKQLLALLDEKPPTT